MSQPEFKAKLVLEATVSPSEDAEKVSQAMKNVLGGARCDTIIGPGSARLTSEDPMALVHIRNQLRDRHVRSAARKQLLLSSSARSATLMLNRQAATSGVIAICANPEESPLGPIYLTVHSERIGEAVDWLTAYAG
jgi:predicted RNA binding protein with dsRBD fold (UPF0201 family)